MPTHPKSPATLVAVLTYAVMAGFFTQSGVILAPAATSFGRSLPDTATIFSYLLGGNLLGIIASLRIFAYLAIRETLIFAYAVMFAGIAMLWLTHTFWVAAIAVAVVGFGGGLGLSTGAVVISKTYAAHHRAAAFLGTDCAFSVAGFVVPAIVAVAIGHGYPWPIGYLIVGVLAALVLLVAVRVRFPAPGPTTEGNRQPTAPLDKSTIVRIGLFGLGLALYLCGQSVFLIWSPSYLQQNFGLSALEGAKAVSSFWGPSIFGLVAAALLVTRFAPRTVLIVATTIATICLVLIATANSAGTYLALTLGFGFTSTCMYKLMISIGSEQIVDPPPQLLTFLLLSGSVGGVVAPFASAGVVRALGPHAGPGMALSCYGAAFAAIVVALVIEKSARPNLAATAVS